MSAAAANKRVQTDHVIAFRATDLVQSVLHALTLNYTGMYIVQHCTVTGKPEAARKKKIILIVQPRLVSNKWQKAKRE